MHAHHQQPLELFVNRCKDDPAILAIVLGGSIAHGFAQPESDIDIILVVEETEYLKRREENKLAFCVLDICTYAGGYIDCKVVSLSFLNKIIERGSDPARYAFQDSRIVWSKVDDLSEIMERVTRYPMQEADSRRMRFASQILAWKWYYGEAVKKQNLYLKTLAIQKITLFACRLVLNENRMLYPYHKWLLNVVRAAPRQPDEFDSSIERLLAHHSQDDVNAFCLQTLQFVGLDGSSLDWPNYFLHDSELNWITHEAPIDDL